MFEVLSLWQMQPCMQEICCNAAWIRTPFQYLLLSAPPEKETLSNSARDPHIWMHPPNAVSWLLDTRDPVAHCGRNNVFKSSRSSLALHLPSMARGLRGFWSDSVRGRFVALKHLHFGAPNLELSLWVATNWEAAQQRIGTRFCGMVWSCLERIGRTVDRNMEEVWRSNTICINLQHEFQTFRMSWKTIKSPSPARNASYTKLMTAGAAHGPGIYLATELGRWMLVKGTTLWEQQYGKNRYIQRWFIKKRKVWRVKNHCDCRLMLNHWTVVDESRRGVLVSLVENMLCFCVNVLTKDSKISFHYTRSLKRAADQPAPLKRQRTGSLVCPLCQFVLIYVSRAANFNIIQRCLLRYIE